MNITKLLEPKTGVSRWLTIIGCFLYIVSPIDLMPEAVLGPFGLGDDALAFVALLRHLLFPGHKT
jgi:uncharacterized membrane protein YkvA (DUF1232 family)